MEESTHYCDEHECTYKKFEKEGKVWYAHKNGDYWCNEAKKKGNPESDFDKSTTSKAKAISDNEMTKGDWAEKDRVKQLSIESQQAAEYTTELWIAGKLQDGEPEIVGLRDWIRDRLCAKLIPEAVQSKSTPPSAPSSTKTYSITKLAEMLKSGIAQKLPGWENVIIRTALEELGAEGKTLNDLLVSLTPENYQVYCDRIRPFEDKLTPKESF